MIGGGDDDHVATVFDKFDMRPGHFFDQAAAVHRVVEEKIVRPEQDADRNGQVTVTRGHTLEIFDGCDQIGRRGNVAARPQRQ